MAGVSQGAFVDIPEISQAIFPLHNNKSGHAGAARKTA